MKKGLLPKIVFVLIFIKVVIIGISYGSGLLFFQLNQMPLEGVTPFTIWEYWQVYHQSPVKSVRLSVNLCAFGPYVLMLVAAVLVLCTRSQRSLHGDARFATLQEARQAGLIDPKDGLERTVLVGRFKEHYLTYGGFQFVMLAAPTRSGKGVGIVIPNCLNYSDSIVVLDIKFENYDITSGFRKAHGQEVYLFAPFGRFNENIPIEQQQFKTHRWNPLDYVSTDPAARVQDIDAIASALYSTANEKDAFWSDMAKDLFRGLCLMVLETEGIPHTLGEILRQASGKGKTLPEHVREMLANAADAGHPYSNACCDALNRIINSSDNTLNNILNTFNAKLLTFANPRVDAATSASDFDLRQVRRKRMSIYLGVSPNDLGIASFIINLFFDQLLNLNTRTLPSQDKTLKYQCLLIMDEFTAIGKVNMIQKAISYQAGFNMRVMTIIQNKSQLEDVYGKSGALTLMANHALMIMYAPSPVVQSDANEYSEMLGYQTVKSTSKSRSHGHGGSNSESISDQRRALMLPQEIKELGRWREIVSLENCKPILCDKIKYFEDPTFTARTNWEVAPIPPLDMDLFVATIEDRRRDLQEGDAAREGFAQHVAGIDNIELPQPLDVNDLTEDDYRSLVEDTVDAIADAVVKTPIDLERYRMSDGEAAAITEELFASGDDDTEDAIEVRPAGEDAAAASGQAQPEGAAEAPAADDDPLSALKMFGFEVQDDVDETGGSAPEGGAADSTS